MKIHRIKEIENFEINLTYNTTSFENFIKEPLEKIKDNMPKLVKFNLILMDQSEIFES